MAFDLDTWKEQVGERLQGWRPRMQRAGVNSAYAFLSAAALWPVVEAARAGDWAALSALGGVLAGVGGNLLANRIQDWKDEADAAQDLQQALPEEGLLVELDAVLAKMEALEQARGALRAEERAAFEATLREELSQLGSSLTIKVTEVGDGALAMGKGAKAVGKDGVLVEDQVDGDVVTGEKRQVSVDGIKKVERSPINVAGGDVKQTVVLAQDGAQVYLGEQPVEMRNVDRATGLGRYLAYMIAHNRYLQLQGIRSGGRLVHIELDQIYITLRATQQRSLEGEDEWLKAEAALAPGESLRQAGGRLMRGERIAQATVTVKVEQALAEQRRLVVLGDPGCGKTTLLRYLALLYARDLAQDRDDVSVKLGLA
jgi:hypothetical protein